MGKAELEASLRSLDIWLIAFGVLVAIGAVGGSVAGFLHWRRSGDLQDIQTAENFSLQRDVQSLASKQEESRAQIADAQARAAEAQLELARLKAPRRLQLDQAKRIADKLVDFVGMRVTMGAYPPLFESLSLVEPLRATLEMGLLTVQIMTPEAAATVGAARGIVVRYTTGNKRGEALAKTLMAALTTEGLPTSIQSGLQETSAAIIEREGGSRNDASLELVVVLIGEKT